MARRSRLAPQVALKVVPVSLAQACEFVTEHHRHHRRLKIHKFSVGVARVDDGQLVGVAIVARPAATGLDDGHTLEVSRTCTDGTANANSMLYGAAWRAAKAMGYQRLVTYTQAGESGASLRGAGWSILAHRPPRGGWNMPKRPRVDHHQTQIPRTLWMIGGCNETQPVKPASCNETRCAAPGCSTVINQPATGRKRLHCSPACRVRAHRARRLSVA
ncbi:XF1762 family protein [Mycobacteroides abscessus]|uniref:XF1762 family protein n=1 Tax=Mycobacteroides abscessus TaxID=36809 RepID=UPI00311F3279